MSQTTKNIFLALLSFFALVGLFLFSINKPLTPIDNEFKDEIRSKDSIIGVLTDENEIKDSLLQLKHTETIKEIVIQKINTKYVAISDSIHVLPRDSQTEFIRQFYGFR